MNKTIENLRQSLVGIRGSTISAGLVDSIRVDYYGQKVPIKQLANTFKLDSNIVVEPYEPNMVGAINKTLGAAGFASFVFSKTQIMVTIPVPSGDQKQETIKHVQKLGEDAKISIRNVRQKFRKKLDADKEIQRITDASIAEIIRVVDNKVNNL